MRIIVPEFSLIALVFSLIALASPSQAAQQTGARNNDPPMEQKCRDSLGKEPNEGEGRSHMGQLWVQRFDHCMMGMPH